MSRVVHFEFATPDPAREVEFFSTVFGWEISNWGDEPYWLVGTGKDEPGIDGAIMPQSKADEQRVVNTVSVADLDGTVTRAVAAGATVAVEKQEIPGVGWIAYVSSPTGILFGMLEPMPGGEMGQP